MQMANNNNNILILASKKKRLKINRNRKFLISLSCKLNS